jgi:hypothetical protein
VESRPGHGTQTRAEEALRLLAGAANAVRLYPESSPLREAAIRRFTETSAALSAQAPLQFVVDRKGFVIEGTPVGQAYPQVAALAESLHALQVGQLIVAPGITEREVKVFLQILGLEARAVRGAGGMRDALLHAEVSNLAVVEVSLRTSTEAGIMGIDLTVAPIEEIAEELPGLAHEWLTTMQEGSGSDDMAAAIDRLETAARDLATRRVAEALLRLDESTRTNIVTAAMQADSSGKRMDGMLRVIAKMTPAALARLLKIVASRFGQEPSALADMIDIPPEVARELQALLTPPAQTAEQRGVPSDPRIEEMAQDMTDAQEQDSERIEQLVAVAKSTPPAGRALATTVDIAHLRPYKSSLEALGEAIPPAIRASAFREVGAAVSLLRELASNSELSPVIAQIRSTFSDPELLGEVCRGLADNPEEEGAVAILLTAGPAGAEALMATYIGATEAGRVALQPTVARLTESIGPVASRIVRTGDPRAAAAVVRVLLSLRDKRVLPTIAQALEHLDVEVRSAAITAIAELPGIESTQLLQKALSHWDPETRRLAASEIGRLGIRDAVPTLLKTLEDMRFFDRNHELKKEVLKSLEILRPAEAVPILNRITKRRLVIGKQNRELRYLARRVLASIQRENSGT